MFVSVLQDRTASIWRLPDLVHVVTLKGHKRRIFSVEFSTVDQCVMTASGDKTVKIWAISDGSCLKTFEGHTSSVLRASFITDGTQFVSCGKFHYPDVVSASSFLVLTFKPCTCRCRWFIETLECEH